MQDETVGILVGLAFLVAVGGFLLLIRQTLFVASRSVEYTPEGGVKQVVAKGGVIPASAIELVLAADYSKRTISALRFFVVGKDNRVSTSKTIMFAWTFALVFGLVALIVAYWLGATEGW